MKSKRYTVILIYPDTVADQYGEDFYWAHVSAENPASALTKARAEVFYVNELTEDDCDPVAFACVACLEGWHYDQNPEG